MPQQVRVSREDSVRRSRSLTKSFKGLFKSSSITPPPSSATSGSSASYSAHSPKNAPPVSSLAKLALATHHETNACHNGKSDESVISDDSSIKIKSASIASGILERDHELSPSPMLQSGHLFSNDEDLGTDAEYSSKAQSSRSNHSVDEGAGVDSTEASIDAKLEREVTPSLIYSQNTARQHRLSTRSRSASAGRRKECCYGTVPHVSRQDEAKKQYIIQQEHFRVSSDGHHEHLLKIVPLVVQAVDTHKTRSAFSLSAVFKSHKVEDDEMAEALSILPEADRELPRNVNILMKDVLKDVMKDVDYINEKGLHSDENHGHLIQHETDNIPKIVNEHAAIGRDELKLINNLAERINNGIQKLSKHIPNASTPTLKAARDRQVLAEKYGKCIGMIGHGSYGTVWVTSKNVPCDHSNDSLVARTYKETFGWNGKLFYAVKELKPRVDESQEKFSTRLTSEFVIGHSLSGQLSQTTSTALEAHPNILKVFDLMQTQDSFIEVFEFCPSGDLYSLLTRHSKSGSGLHPLEADCFMKQLLHGVQFMHDHGVAHCDLKPENILFTPVGVLKICDFGSSSVFQTAWEKNVHFQIGAVGSEPYVAPEEFIPRKEYDARLVDCWSCGVIYCTMVLGHYLWKIANRDKDQIYNTFVEDMTENGEYYVFEEMRHINHEINRCRKMCLYNIFQWNPKKRITIPKLLETPWMRKTNCCVSYKVNT